MPTEGRGEQEKPTPGPWETDGVVVWAGAPSFDIPVCVMTSRTENNLTEPAEMAPESGLENAALIVRAVNSHDALVLSLKRAKELLDCWASRGVQACAPDHLCPACYVCADAEKALAAAEGR